jgi:hypothetical protein
MYLPSLSVAVLEAGESNLDDLNIVVPGNFGKMMGNPKVPITGFTDDHLLT